MIVTIDGPGGTGKSTVSRVVAHKAGLPHLDTGAFYRAATLAVIEAGVDPRDESSVMDVVRHRRFGQEGGAMYLDGRDVSLEIRGEAITAEVSAVSAHPHVRHQNLKVWQKMLEQKVWRGYLCQKMKKAK